MLEHLPHESIKSFSEVKVRVILIVFHKNANFAKKTKRIFNFYHLISLSKSQFLGMSDH